jgi:hypothetical protein
MIYWFHLCFTTQFVLISQMSFEWCSVSFRYFTSSFGLRVFFRFLKKRPEWNCECWEERNLTKSTCRWLLIAIGQTAFVSWDCLLKRWERRVNLETALSLTLIQPDDTRIRARIHTSWLLPLVSMSCLTLSSLWLFVSSFENARRNSKLEFTSFQNVWRNSKLEFSTFENARRKKKRIPPRVILDIFWT